MLTYVIAESCIDVTDRSCVDECPVDCIYEGSRKLYIHPEECIDCGACEPVCPVDAISTDYEVPAGQEPFIEDNARFFGTLLAGSTKPVGSPGSARSFGPVGVDTQLVAGYEDRSQD